MSEYVFRTNKPIEYCYECPLNNSENSSGKLGICKLGVATYGLDVPKHCPLAELPTHGKLKDTDVIINTIKEATRDAFGKGDTLRYGYLLDVIDMIEKAPTILEAIK